MRSRALLPALLVLAGLAAGLGRPAAAEEEVVEKARAAIVAAAAKDERALSKALDDANSLVGEVFPDGGDLADWLGTLPDPVPRRVTVEVRRGWLYVVARKGEEAKGPLERVLAVDPKHAEARAYLGEAKRLVGDAAGAASDLLRALEAGAADALVLPAVRRVVIGLHEKPPAVVGEALPAYAEVAGRFLQRRRMDDVSRAVADWLDWDAWQARSLPRRAAFLRAEAVRRAWDWVEGGAADEAVARARKAYEAAEWASTLGDLAKSVPDRFELLAAAVRLGETGEVDRHEVPEAVAALAEVALERGRFVLAASLARRRLAISDSPAARRVLLGVPPDVGD